MTEPPEVILQRLFVIAIEFMVSQYWEVRDLFLAEFFVHLVKRVPVFLRTSPSRQITQMDDKGWLTPGDFIDDQFSFLVISFPPKLPATRALRITDNNKEILRSLNIRKARIGRCVLDFVPGKGLEGMDWDEETHGQ